MLKTSTNISLSSYLYPDNIDSFLENIGITCEISGYKFLKEAVAYLIKNSGFESIPIRKIWFNIGEKYEVTPISIESSIRRIIDATWNNGENLFAERLSYNENKKPSMTMFLKYIISRLNE